jgi:hypothetical protein
MCVSSGNVQGIFREHSQGTLSGDSLREHSEGTLTHVRLQYPHMAGRVVARGPRAAGQQDRCEHRPLISTSTHLRAHSDNAHTAHSTSN